jgi:CheY-like chemotaxis protein
MVVEDEPEIYQLLMAMFEMWGIEGVAFVDGEEAVQWIDDVDQGRYEGDLPELALLDIRLPGDVKGFHVGARLRKSAMLGNIAMVLTTSYRLRQDEYAEIMQISGADKYLPKPLPKFNELQGILESVILERKRLTQATLSALSVETHASDAAEVEESPTAPSIASGAGEGSAERAAGDSAEERSSTMYVEPEPEPGPGPDRGVDEPAHAAHTSADETAADSEAGEASAHAMADAPGTPASTTTPGEESPEENDRDIVGYEEDDEARAEREVIDVRQRDQGAAAETSVADDADDRLSESDDEADEAPARKAPDASAASARAPMDDSGSEDDAAHRTEE